MLDESIKLLKEKWNNELHADHSSTRWNHLMQSCWSDISYLFFVNFIYLILDFMTTRLLFMEVIVMVGLSWFDNFNVSTPIVLFLSRLHGYQWLKRWAKIWPHYTAAWTPAGGVDSKWSCCSVVPMSKGSGRKKDIIVMTLWNYRFMNINTKIGLTF